MDDARARFLRDRVLTATPGQRVVMLYDRLVLDLTRAVTAEAGEVTQHTSHACEIVAELFGSLDLAAGGPADNLAGIYGYLLRELMAQPGSNRSRDLRPLLEIVTGLRTAWVAATAATDSAAAAEVTGRSLVGSWVG
jgi:flagellar secretion chaperone FliS